ncbi:N-acetylglucosamine-6-phosphate deacetylase [Chamaesiphon sp. OTE_75_metabat_556]|uniref:N-acetylglucosamine-6-phosphate deacetylase n=1 Tax=Chamaesiphon sp. OTE_75_metabat_556 TaxID=2964692 RepID=UPI00286CDCFB|nr:N-acetylglucosamine-6-phosphate deacetylase [Chamaesiphon sp. OTE_75_metabat_556]
MKDCKVTNAQIPGYEGLHEIVIRDEQIVAIAPSITIDLPTIDVDGDWVSLGGVDLQINGALGLAFPDVQMTDLVGGACQNDNRLQQICDFLWAQGVDEFLPTIVTTSIENIHRSLTVFAAYMAQQQPNTAQITGIHLEGPFLNPQKRGAHPQAYLLPLELDFVTKILSKYTDIIRIITLAPELDQTSTIISHLRSLGIIVSLGHSQANFAQAESAFAGGASMVTHAFNAMPGLHHREPGLLGAALTQPHVKCGFIADGQHVHPAMLKVLVRAGRYGEGLFLVSDALSPLGLPDGKYPWDDREIEVIDGTARLADGTLSGTTRSLLVGVQNLVRWGVCDIGEAINLATIAPRRAIGLSGDYVGQAANLLRWSSDLNGKLSWQRLEVL